jgi:hypothetical protein
LRKPVLRFEQVASGAPQIPINFTGREVDVLFWVKGLARGLRSEWVCEECHPDMAMQLVVAVKNFVARASSPCFVLKIHGLEARATLGAQSRIASTSGKIVAQKALERRKPFCLPGGFNLASEGPIFLHQFAEGGIVAGIGLGLYVLIVRVGAKKVMLSIRRSLNDKLHMGIPTISQSQVITSRFLLWTGLEGTAQVKGISWRRA